MTTVDLLLRLRSLAIAVTLDADRLKISGPADALTPELRAELAARKAELVAFLREGAAVAGPAIARIPPAAPAPLSFTQQRFWFFHHLVPDSSAYHVCFGLRLEGRLDRAVLGRAIDEIVRRHALLRSVFVAPEGEPTQWARPAGPVALPLIDLSALDPAERTARFDRLSREVASAPFRLSEEPPLRVTLFALGQADHALIVAMHHIASDAWSVTTFIRELAALYGAFAAGRSSPLPELPVQYADFAAWQRSRVSAGSYDAQREYWSRQLADAPTLQLPTSRPRPAFQTFTGGRTTFVIPKRLGDALDAVARQERGTLFMALLAGFYVLLHRYSGQRDLVVGTAIAGRSRGELEPLIGPFINSLALRTDLSGNPTFRTVLARTRETALQAYANQDLPFEKIVDELRIDRALNRNPLFQVMLALQNVPPAPAQAADLTLTGFDIDRSTTVSDLELIFWPTAAGLEGYVRYSADLFEAAAIERMLRHFAVLLEAAAANPDRAIGDLPLLTDEEQAALAGWNRTSTDYPRARAVHHAFADQARLTPAAAAVAWRGAALSYGELEARANRLAHRLVAAGVRPDDRVAVLLERSPSFVIAALGIMKAGAAYLPVEPTCPPDRLSYMLQDAGAGVAVTAPDLAAAVRRCGVEALTLADPDRGDRPDDAPTGAVAPDVAVQAASLAYVIYTSGSTGRPKGVAIAHAGLQNLVAWHQRVYGVTAVDRAALVAGLGFDASVWELWPYLLCGACVHIPDDETRASAALLLEWLARSRVSICFAPTPLAEAMFDTPMPRGLALRSLLTGGDKLHHVPAGLPFAVYNNYGPTESTVVTSWTAVAGGASETPSIGRPVDNTRIHVLDARFNAVPIGVPGELCIAGDSLARGYLHRPDLTAERFVPDPFAPEAGGRMYRTGDLVRRAASGELEFLGRIDDQVKVRGFRIELGEIEAVLGQHPAVREAVVVTREGRAGNRRLVAYVVTRDGSSDVAALTRFLKDALPDYMIPSAIVALDALPVTANGKVDRQALPDPGELRPAVQDLAEPSGDVERALAAIWARVLRVDRVGPHENFFEAGGDSILALQVVSAARQAGIKVTPRQIFEQPTVAELASVADVPEARIATDDVADGEVPLTPIQRWFLDQDVPRPEHFNQAALLLARRPLDQGLVERALRVLTAEHDALRLRFERAGDGWRQFYSTPGADDLSVETIDARGVSGASREDLFRAEGSRLQASLHLGAGPLVRAAIFECGPQERQRLFIAIHHLVVDTVSWRVLLADLELVYEQLASGQPPSLPAKTSSFKRWAAELVAFAGSGAMDGEAEYWRAAAAPGAAVPLDRTGANTAGSIETMAFDLDAAETDALLRAAPRAYGLQANELLIAAVARSLAEWTGDPRVTLSIESHGREALTDDLDLSRSVGWFTAMYPLSLDVAGHDAGELLKRVKEQVRGVPRLGIGYGALRYLRQPRLEAARPDVSFNYLGQFDGGAASEAGVFAIAAEPTGDSSHPELPRAHVLDVSARIVDGTLRVTFVYSRNLHWPETVESFAHAVLDAVRQLIGHCQAPDTGGYTPSDFPEAQVSQGDLDKLFASLGVAGRNQG